MAGTRRDRLVEAGIRGAAPVLGLVARGDGKLAAGVRARSSASDDLVAWQRAHRDSDRPLVWFHAPSVGEALMAKAIVGALRRRRPDVQIAFTHFSPSAERVADDVGADVVGYLPWDTARHTGRAVAALRPAVVACVRTEVWPVLARSATEGGGRVALVNAVMSPGSGRLRPLGRWLLAPTWARLDAVGVVAARDEPLFRRLGVPAQRIRVTGDARFDQVWQRAERLRADAARLERMRRRLPPGRAVVVAGSTWPADHRTLAPAIGALARAGGAGDRAAPPFWILAPHEPTARHLTALERLLETMGVRAVRLGDVRQEPVQQDALIIDRVGMLADLYAVADVAYVGGGFHSKGLHSVVEPAALGAPVLFGPRHGNAREAAELAASGGGVQVEGATALEGHLRRLLAAAAARAEAGSSARRFVQERLGGADRNAALLADLIEPAAGG